MALLIILNVGLATYMTPINDFLGDSPEYILLAQSFLGHASGVNLAHRSPLYSIILAGFMLFFKPALLYKAIVFFQYMLVGFTSWMVYLLFRRFFTKPTFAMLTALLFNLSFATIYFANIILTETLAVFLIVLSVTILMLIFDKGKLKYYLIFGILVGLDSLARFNAIPLIITFLTLLFIGLFYQKASIKQYFFSLGAFFVPYLLIINAWCFYNQYHNGFYGLIPHIGSKVSRNVIVASIRPEDTVSEANQAILDIFVEARKTLYGGEKKQLKSGLARLDKFDLLPELYRGYLIYRQASPQLRDYFHLPPSAGEYELSLKIADFYKEIVAQNRAFILKFRFISLLSSFRASASGVLPLGLEYGNINLNILPAIVFKIYKLAFIAISMFVFVAFFFFVGKGIKNGWHFDFTLLTMFFIIFSYWGINFVFATVSDAWRFKFPADPFIIGLFVYYVIQIGDWLIERKGMRQKEPIK